MNEDYKRIVNEMTRNGVPNHSKALFFGVIAAAAKDSNSENLCSEIKIKDSQIHRIAARMVYEYLSRTGLKITLQTIQIEGPRKSFSNNNIEKTDVLNLPSNKQTIAKLIRQRYATQGIIHSDSDEDGWFEIDSEMERTMTVDENTIESTYAFGDAYNKSLETYHPGYAPTDIKRKKKKKKTKSIAHESNDVSFSTKHSDRLSTLHSRMSITSKVSSELQTASQINEGTQPQKFLPSTNPTKRKGRRTQSDDED